MNRDRLPSTDYLPNSYQTISATLLPQAAILSMVTPEIFGALYTPIRISYGNCRSCKLLRLAIVMVSCIVFNRKDISTKSFVTNVRNSDQKNDTT